MRCGERGGRALVASVPPRGPCRGAWVVAPLSRTKETTGGEEGCRIGDDVESSSGGRHGTVVAIRERSDRIEMECA